jgi:cyclopropane fatty-acyl-phospholipid synthase-like methyltransferase
MIISSRVLDIGCGWGTLVAFAAKNFGCDVTGVTIAKEQAQFGNERIKNNGYSFLLRCFDSNLENADLPRRSSLPEDKARVLTVDFRDLPAEPAGRFNKIVSLEMAEVFALLQILCLQLWLIIMGFCL